MIKIEHVTKIYGKKKNTFTALNDVSFEILDGASVAIVGKSGSGKSTLMHVMSGLDRPQQGKVLVNEVDILKMKDQAVDRFRGETMAFVFQSFFVQGEESCMENVGLPLEINQVKFGERSKRAKKALDRVELKGKYRQKAKNLSGGEKQRLAVARAVINRPKILFADEPTGNLDTETGEKVVKLLFELNEEGTTLIIVTHDEELAAKCKAQIYLRDGKIVKINGKGVKK
jgi:putative ABC transport system ATP-binding protein